MIKFTKKLAIVASLVTLYSVQFACYGSNNNNLHLDQTDHNARGLISMSTVTQEPRFGLSANMGGAPKPVVQIIIEYASEESFPLDLMLVCKSWRNAMLELNTAQPDQRAGKQNFFGSLFKKIGVRLSHMNNIPTAQPSLKADLSNPFMQKCINKWSEARFKNGILLFNYCDSHTKLDKDSNSKPITDTVCIMNVSDCLYDQKNAKRAFNLSQCENAGEDLRITLSVDEFFEVDGENENRLVILFATYQMVAQTLQTSGKPFASIIKEWNPIKGPVAMFSRMGSNKDVNSFDYLLNDSPASISRATIHQNLEKNSKVMEASLNSMGPSRSSRIVHNMINFKFIYEPRLLAYTKTIYQ